MTYIIPTAVRTENRLTEEVRQIRVKGLTAANCHGLWKVLEMPPGGGCWNCCAALDDRLLVYYSMVVQNINPLVSVRPRGKLSHVGFCNSGEDVL